MQIANISRKILNGKLIGICIFKRDVVTVEMAKYYVRGTFQYT